jgi:2-polyprenyl-6-methoxyphenol hydroxylase-like FAD-dependent oxidoreductase
MPFRVLIVGGGLSGLTLANGLLKHAPEMGLEVQVFERDSEDMNREGIPSYT